MKRLFCMAVVLFSCVQVWAQDIDSLISNRSLTLVTDPMHILSVDEKKKLETKLAKFDDQTSTQIAVVLIKTLDGRDIEEVSLNLFNTWGIGQKEWNNGLLVLAAIQDRKVRIQVGTGLEPTIPNDTAARIIRDDIVPAFKASNYYEGLNKATNSLMKLARTAFPPQIDSTKADTTPVGNNNASISNAAITSHSNGQLLPAKAEGPYRAAADNWILFSALAIGLVSIAAFVYKKLGHKKTVG
ncbi:MAG: TPM domain-containing protein [Chitinophagaceae bacterium]|nr:TPM domain-containing protein [Chitinophagaceae bacterium]